VHECHRCDRRGNFGREQNLDYAIKGGAQLTGNAMCDDGIVIDLSPLRHCDVDADRRMVRVEAGRCSAISTPRPRPRACDPSASTHDGIAGLSWARHRPLMRGMPHHRQPCRSGNGDATGERVRAAEDENVDLFGLFARGGNFGVVTSLRFAFTGRTGPSFGMILYRAERAREVLRFYRPCPCCTRQAGHDREPAESAAGAVHPAPCTVRWSSDRFVLLRRHRGGREVLRPFRDLRPTCTGEAQPFVEFQAMLDPTVPGLALLLEVALPGPLSDAHRRHRRAGMALPIPRSYTLLPHMAGL